MLKCFMQAPADARAQVAACVGCMGALNTWLLDLSANDKSGSTMELIVKVGLSSPNWPPTTFPSSPSLSSCPCLLSHMPFGLRLHSQGGEEVATQLNITHACTPAFNGMFVHGKKLILSQIIT